MAVGRRPPHNVQTLQRLVSQRSRAEGIAVMRLQRWISYMVVAAALDRVRDERDEPLFAAKGGDRSRDLIDLLLLRSLVTNLAAVRVACVHTFEIRDNV